MDEALQFLGGLILTHSHVTTVNVLKRVNPTCGPVGTMKAGAGASIQLVAIPRKCPRFLYSSRIAFSEHVTYNCQAASSHDALTMDVLCHLLEAPTARVPLMTYACMRGCVCVCEYTRCEFRPFLFLEVQSQTLS